MVQMERAVVLIVILAVCYWEAASSLPAVAHDASAPHPRFRRNSTAMGLAGAHTNSAGHNRPVGQIHGVFQPRGGGTLPNYNIGATAGLGTVLWRSPNQQHSIGVGATVDHTRGSHAGLNFQSPPNLNAGVGYKWRF